MILEQHHRNWWRHNLSSIWPRAQSNIMSIPKYSQVEMEVHSETQPVTGPQTFKDINQVALMLKQMLQNDNLGSTNLKNHK
jgi:hypothetical protein